MALTRIVVTLVPLAVLLPSGCNSSGHKTSTTPSEPVATTASVLLGPQGGTLVVGTVQLVVPPGALESEVRLTGTLTSGLPRQLPNGRLLGDTFNVAPEGIVFQNAAVLTMPAPTGTPNVTLARIVDSSPPLLERLATRVAEGKLTAAVKHFSGVGPSDLVDKCDDNEQNCPDDQICCGGICLPQDNDNCESCNPCSGGDVCCRGLAGGDTDPLACRPTEWCGCGADACTAPAICCPFDRRFNPPTRKCAGPGNDDPLNCGACNVDCSKQNSGGPLCCSGECTDPKRSNKHCGADCNARPCPSGSECCDGTCKNVKTDPNNCGSCGSVCPAGVTCADSKCQGEKCGDGYCEPAPYYCWNTNWPVCCKPDPTTSTGLNCNCPSGYHLVQGRCVK